MASKHERPRSDNTGNDAAGISGNIDTDAGATASMLQTGETECGDIMTRGVGTDIQLVLRIPSALFLTSKEIEELQRQFVDYYVDAGVKILEKNNVVPVHRRAYVAEQCVVKGLEITSNADGPGDSPKEELTSLHENVARVINQPSRTCSFLFLIAPTTRRGRVQSYMLDDKISRGECDRFSRDLTVSLTERSLIPHAACKLTVRSLPVALQSIRAFINSERYRALVVYFLFDGHGDRNGLCFEDGSCSFDEFLTPVNEAVNARHDFKPGLVKVWFCQCYGHYYQRHISKEAFNRIEIEALSSKETPTTTSLYYKPEYSTAYVVNCEHVELQCQINGMVNEIERINRPITIVLDSDPSADYTLRSDNTGNDAAGISGNIDTDAGATASMLQTGETECGDTMTRGVGTVLPDTDAVVGQIQPDGHERIMS